MVTGTDDLGPLAPHATTTEPSDYGNSGLVPYSWFKDCTNPTAGDGTEFTAAWANRILKYIRRACDGMGIARDEGDTDRLLKAIQKAIAVMENLGAGHVIFAGVDGGTGHYQFKSLVAGTNCSISHDGNEITINALATGGSPPGAASVGTGQHTLKGLNGGTNNYEFRSVLAGDGVTVTLVGDDIVIAAPGPGRHCMGGGTASAGPVVVSNPSGGFWHCSSTSQSFYWTWNTVDLIGVWEVTIASMQFTAMHGLVEIEASFDGGTNYVGVIGANIDGTEVPPQAAAANTRLNTFSVSQLFSVASGQRSGGVTDYWVGAARLGSLLNIAGLALPRIRVALHGATGLTTWGNPSPTLCLKA